MVAPGARGRRGSSSLGCLFSLMLFVGALYFGLPIGQAYWQYTQLHDEMRRAVRFAQTSSDDAMLRQILLRVDQLGLPAPARRIRINRVEATRRVTIQTAWSVVVELPFTQHELRFRPRVEGVF